MTKYRQIKFAKHHHCVLFDKKNFEIFLVSNKDLTKLEKNMYVEFSYFGEINYGTGVIETFATHGGGGYIYHNHDEPIKEIFIATTFIELDDAHNLLKDGNLNEILGLTNYPSNKKIKIFDNISITSNELIVYSFDNEKLISFKVPNGTHPIYEIYDESYLNNIEAEKWRVEEDKKNSFRSEDDPDYIPDGQIHDWALEDPNIHFLYLNFANT